MKVWEEEICTSNSCFLKILNLPRIQRTSQRTGMDSGLPDGWSGNELTWMTQALEILSPQPWPQRLKSLPSGPSPCPLPGVCRPPGCPSYSSLRGTYPLPPPPLNFWHRVKQTQECAALKGSSQFPDFKIKTTSTEHPSVRSWDTAVKGKPKSQNTGPLATCVLTGQ